MLRACGEIGLDWGEVSLSGYLEAVEAHNEALDPASSAPEPSDFLKRLVNGETADNG